MFAVVGVKINNECFQFIPRFFNGILIFSFCTAELYNTRLCTFFYKLFMHLINSLHQGRCARAINTQNLANILFTFNNVRISIGNEIVY